MADSPDAIWHQAARLFQIEIVDIHQTVYPLYDEYRRVDLPTMWLFLGTLFPSGDCLSIGLPTSQTYRPLPPFSQVLDVVDGGDVDQRMTRSVNSFVAAVPFSVTCRLIDSPNLHLDIGLATVCSLPVPRRRRTPLLHQVQPYALIALAQRYLQHLSHDQELLQISWAILSFPSAHVVLPPRFWHIHFQ